MLHRAATAALSLPPAGENTLRALATAALAAATTARAVSCLVPQNSAAAAGSLPTASLSPARLSPALLSPALLSSAYLPPATLSPASLSSAQAVCSSSIPAVPTCPNCEEELNPTHQCDDVPLASSSGTNNGLCDMAKIVLFSMATTGQSKVMPAKPDPPRTPN